jgi:hypothetical protein
MATSNVALTIDHRLRDIGDRNSTQLIATLAAELVPRLTALAAMIALSLSGASESRAVTQSFPAPPAGATVFARQLGSDALALNVVPRRGGLLVQASLLGRQGTGVPGRHISFTVAGQVKPAAACGAGCYRASFKATGSSPAVDVNLPHGVRWHVQLPATWPAPDASVLLRRAGQAWRSLRSLTFKERLASGTGQAVVSTWRVQAPDRLSYVVEGGWSAVVIGERRWDRGPGATRWTASPQTRLHQPVPFWVSVTDAHVLGNLTFHGRPAVRASFYDPGSHAWFTVVLDQKTHRTLDSHMVTNAHFMHDTYGSFNSTPPVVAPQ